LDEYERMVRERVEKAQTTARMTGWALHLALRGGWAKNILAGLERDRAFETAVASVAVEGQGSQAFLARMLPRLPAILISGAGE
jgi:hypothetical protein